MSLAACDAKSCAAVLSLYRSQARQCVWLPPSLLTVFGMPCASPQRQRLQAMLAELEAWWAANIGRLNDQVRSARTILASNDPATVPATTVLHRSQARRDSSWCCARLMYG